MLLPRLQPVYTPHNCHPAYQLNWSMDIFWRIDPSLASNNAVQIASLLANNYESLHQAVKGDGINLLNYHFDGATLSQFFLSTSPAVSPLTIIQRVKGRLQYLISNERPAPFRRNYSCRSIGAADRNTVEQYVSGQVAHHHPADPSVELMLQELQINRPDVDLAQPRFTQRAMYWYNLHLVLVADGRWREIRRDVLLKRRELILKIAASRGHLLSRAGILPDHLHLTVGCPLGKSPEEIALCYMNNLAFAFGMKPWLKFSYYVGTFGEYDRGVIMQAP